jgi:hypothetical protein
VKNKPLKHCDGVEERKGYRWGREKGWKREKRRKGKS